MHGSTATILEDIPEPSTLVANIINAITQEPWALLDEDGNVLAHGGGMQKLDALSDGIQVRAGILRCGDPHSQVRLSRAIAEISGAARPRISGCRINRGKGKTDVIAKMVRIHGLSGESRFPAQAAIDFEAKSAVLVFMVDFDHQDMLDENLLREVFELTQRESEISRLLAEGHSLEVAAGILGIALGTARVHLRNIFTKTGIGRQSDLVRMISRIV